PLAHRLVFPIIKRTAPDARLRGALMQVILETDEAWSIMNLVLFQVLDQVDLLDEAKAVLRRWRTDHNDGTAEMSDLTVTMNAILGTVMDERTEKLIRRAGWYVSTKDKV